MDGNQVPFQARWFLECALGSRQRGVSGNQLPLRARWFPRQVAEVRLSGEYGSQGHGEGCLGLIKRKKKGSDDILALVKVLQAELDIGIPPVVVFDDGVADVERIAGLDVFVEIGHIEGYGRNLVIWL